MQPDLAPITPTPNQSPADNTVDPTPPSKPDTEFTDITLPSTLEATLAVAQSDVMQPVIIQPTEQAHDFTVPSLHPFQPALLSESVDSTATTDPNEPSPKVSVFPAVPVASRDMPTPQESQPPQLTQSTQSYVPPSYVPPQTHNQAQPTAPPQWQPQAQSTQYNPQVPIIMGGPGASFSPPPKSKKKLFILIGTSLATILLVSGGVFGLYLPNTPNNVYNTGINRSGEAINGIVAASTAPGKLATYKTSDISGTATLKFGGTTYAGNFETKFDQTSLDGGLNFTLNDPSSGNKTLNAKVLSELPAGGSFPNIYFQLNGLKALGLDSTAPGISGYDGKWILVGTDYLKSLGSSYFSGAANGSKQVTSSEIAEVARAASSVTKNYVFSTDPKTAIFNNKKFDGKEKVDGLDTYHYTVGINIAHIKAYCSALARSVLSTDAYKKVSGSSASEIGDAKTSASKTCNSGDNFGLKSSDTLDMWVDSKYKLIHKIRAYDDTNKNNYAEIGQLYNGGDNLSLFANSHDATAKSDTKFTLDTNMKTNAAKATLSFVSTSADSPGSATVTLTSKSSTTPVKITKPANPVLIQDVLQKLGYSSSSSSNSSGLDATQGNAKDTKRQTDIQNLQTQLEVYFQTSGSYPTLAQLNSATWRKVNMPSFDDGALQDPDGTNKTLIDTASATQYGYSAGGCNKGGCTSYTLTSQLSDGSSYTKLNLD
jgi:hypothetical protein